MLEPKLQEIPAYTYGWLPKPLYVLKDTNSIVFACLPKCSTVEHFGNAPLGIPCPRRKGYELLFFVSQTVQRFGDASLGIPCARRICKKLKL